MNTSKATVAWTVDLPESAYEDFEALLPVKGSFTGVITMGLRQFLSKIEDEPMLQVWAKEDIARHVHLEERSEKRKRLEISIPTSLYERFNKVIPDWGGTSWFVRRLITSIIAGDHPPLREQVEGAVNRMLTPEVTST